MAEQNIKHALSDVQAELKAPKVNDNDFGGYKYRSAEDILELVKPILKKHSLVLVVSDEMINLGERYYVKATALIVSTETDEQVEATAYAREAFSKKGMDEAQITGSASSYARKYALSGLFNIDDNKDPDTMDNTKHESMPDLPPKERAEHRAKTFLDGRKVKINVSLEEQGFTTAPAKMAFVKSVLGKEVIENGSDANEIEEALRIHSEGDEIQTSE